LPSPLQGRKEGVVGKLQAKRVATALPIGDPQDADAA
jgi:hypothetical protein